LKAITISQPYASKIAIGEKWIENRTWPTRYRGTLAIHAGLGRQYLSKSELSKFPTGKIIAVCQLVACVTIEEILDQGSSKTTPESVIPGCNRTWWEAADHEHAEGPWCWILEDVTEVAHIDITGKQGLWTVDWGAAQLINMHRATMAALQTTVSPDLLTKEDVASGL
jgi:activating signal cointegrator 1